MSERPIPLDELVDYLDEIDPGCLRALRWANGAPDRFVACLIALGPNFATQVLTLAAAAISIAGPDPTAEPADILRIAADAQRYNWSELRDLLTHRFVDDRDY